MIVKIALLVIAAVVQIIQILLGRKPREHATGWYRLAVPSLQTLVLLALFFSIFAVYQDHRSQKELTRQVEALTLQLTQAETDAKEERRKQLQTTTQLQRRTYDKLSRATHSFLRVLSGMIVSASGGWIPATKKEFFSARVSNMICHELDVRAPAPMAGNRGFGELVSERARGYRETLGQVLAESGAVLDGDVVRAIYSVERSSLLAIAEQHPGVVTSLDQMEREHGIASPPLLCRGLEPLVEDSLLSLFELQRKVEAGEQLHGITRNEAWLIFPDAYLKKYQGTFRFGPDTFAKWRKEHPKHTPPAMFGSGKPGKGARLDPRSWRRPSATPQTGSHQQVTEE